MIKILRKINTKDLVEETWSSPKGKFAGGGKEISEALGRKPQSTDLNERHPFDVEILRIPPGKIPYPFHSHSAQWEFYHVISGRGLARHQDGKTPIEAGDAFIFGRGEPDEFINERSRSTVLVGPDLKRFGSEHPDSAMVAPTLGSSVRGAGRLRW